MLEAQASHILLEAAATLNPLALMFSGGKDSACIAHLAKKTFRGLNGEIRIPIQLFHYDSGDNFPEVLRYRDDIARSLGTRLTVFEVIEASRAGLIKAPLDEHGNIPALVELINYSQRATGAKGLIGGGRRDEDPVRAKERIFSLRGSDGAWRPDQQRPELWDLYNTELRPGEHLRIFPISNWTERNVWEYIAQENIPLPRIYFSHEREVVQRNGTLIAFLPDTRLREGERVEVKRVRCRSVGDRRTTGFVESDAATATEVLAEVRASRYSERAGRAEDTDTATAMEPRKERGWF